MTPSAFFSLESFWRCGSLFSKKVPRSLTKKSPSGLFSSLMTTAALVELRVEGVEVFAVKSVGGNAEGITNLTKSKRCPKTLDT